MAFGCKDKIKIPTNKEFLKTKILYLDSRFHGNDNFNGNTKALPL